MQRARLIKELYSFCLQQTQTFCQMANMQNLLATHISRTDCKIRQFIKCLGYNSKLLISQVPWSGQRAHYNQGFLRSAQTFYEWRICTICLRHRYSIVYMLCGRCPRVRRSARTTAIVQHRARRLVSRKRVRGRRPTRSAAAVDVVTN